MTKEEIAYHERNQERFDKHEAENAERERRNYEADMVNQERREDFNFEREFWSGTFHLLVEHDNSFDKAIEGADKALAEYRSRFQ